MAGSVVSASTSSIILAPMAGPTTINKANVTNGNTIQAQDVLNIIEALDGTTANSFLTCN